MHRLPLLQGFQRGHPGRLQAVAADLGGLTELRWLLGPHHLNLQVTHFCQKFPTVYRPNRVGCTAPSNAILRVTFANVHEVQFGKWCT